MSSCKGLGLEVPLMAAVVTAEAALLRITTWVQAWVSSLGLVGIGVSLAEVVAVQRSGVPWGCMWPHLPQRAMGRRVVGEEVQGRMVGRLGQLGGTWGQ